MFNRLSVVSVGDVDPTRRVLEQCRITKVHTAVASCRQFQIPRVIPSLPYKHKNKHTKTTLTTKHKQKPQTNKHPPPPEKKWGHVPHLKNISNQQTYLRKAIIIR